MKTLFAMATMTGLGKRMMNRQLMDQWQVAVIWMRDVNLAATERTPRGLLDRLSSHEIAKYHLNRYFEMVEAQLTPSEVGR